VDTDTSSCPVKTRNSRSDGSAMLLSRTQVTPPKESGDFAEVDGPRNPTSPKMALEPLRCPKPPNDGASQNGKAKSRKARLVAQITRLVRNAGLDCEEWRYVSKSIRRQ
jgi:hypothetical protein